MAETSVKVNPGDKPNAIDIILDKINAKDWPIYKLAFGDQDAAKRVDKDAPLPVSTTQGVPHTFSKQTSNTLLKNISKGNLNKVAVQSRIINEHAESSREIQGVVASGNILGQIFKASKDNISALMLTLESAAGVVVDNFESYADNAAIQAVWIESGTDPATLEQTIVHTGNKAMRLPTTVNGDEWVKTAAAADFTGYTGTFNAYFTHDFSQQQVSVFIGDSLGNSKSFILIQDSAGIWCDCEVNEAAMTDDQAAVTDITDIITIGYRVVLKRIGGATIIDDLFSVPPPGEIEIKLWDMGESIPVSAVTSIDSGNQYEQIGEAEAASYILPLEGGKRLYHIEEFECGTSKAIPTNELLITDHYYIVELKWVDTDVSVYGPDTSFEENYYENGYAFTAPDEASAITAIGEFSDLMFGILSMQDIYIIRTCWRFDNDPNGASNISAFLEDNGMKITDVIVDHEHSPERTFESDITLRPMFLEDGGKVEHYYNDDPTDSVSTISVEITFLYEPPVVHG